ncbi:DUF2806 domain-containing protein [Pseudomonas sp. URMO17WK12:I2]|uniref:DUF2806 domain-containing protein n=1 Tax=Pseudomonas sp. URMO17WK12:I2 TaxID=1261623 RepID=UPI000DB54F18|nr:DUF2806 domain-containing protein [Pseudomonas sp. URMO17WK12:I2]PZW46395.1 uncharacterized protein DUF2806 [Pseudomonas sp. URMO17WK12:I2]
MAQARTGKDMLEGKALIDLGNLTEPATKLIEKISDAVGVLYEPTRVVRLAQAQAHAALIEFNNKNTLTELEQRAVSSALKKEAKKQKNIEKITAKAIETLPSAATPQDIEDDWLSFFFSKCEIISDEAMQRVWAEVLARQAVEASSFSRRTLSILATLESHDAESFLKFCSCAVLFQEIPELFIFDVDDVFYREKDINLGRALELQSLGLVHYSSSSLYLSRSDCPRIEVDDETFHVVELEYFGKKYELLVPEYESPNILVDKPTYEYGCVSLTIAGAEIFQICNAQPIDGFMEKVGSRLKKQGHILRQVI